MAEGKPCPICHRPKPLGRGRQRCDECSASSEQARNRRRIADLSRQQKALRDGAPANGAMRCQKCRSWAPAEHFSKPGHEPPSDHLTRTPLERWLAKVDKTDGCWLWTGTKGPLGYGGFWDGKRRTPAYRAGYELLVGPIPDGLELDHLCRNPSCVRPDHLEPVSHLENVRRGTSGDRCRERQVVKTHCPQGHPYDAENASRRPQGWRRCKACARDYYHRKKAAAHGDRSEADS